MLTPVVAQPSRDRPGAIEIVSPLEPAAVKENLTARAKEWRESAIPVDLRTFKVHSLLVNGRDSYFESHWIGHVSPFYNPVCFGTIEPAGSGSRITVRFKRDENDILPMVAWALSAIFYVITEPSTFSWVNVVVLLIAITYTSLRNRASEPMRTRLIEVLTTAAQQPA